jgi:hypothetical protein
MSGRRLLPWRSGHREPREVRLLTALLALVALLGVLALPSAARADDEELVKSGADAPKIKSPDTEEVRRASASQVSTDPKEVKADPKEIKPEPTEVKSEQPADPVATSPKDVVGDPKQAEVTKTDGAEVKESVGQPGFVESLVPVWGPLRASTDDFQNGRLLSGTVNAALAASDLFPAKAALTVGAKLAVKGVSLAARGLATRFAAKELTHEAASVATKAETSALAKSEAAEVAKPADTPLAKPAETPATKAGNGEKLIEASGKTLDPAKVQVAGPGKTPWGKEDYLLGNVKSGKSVVKSDGKGGFFRGELGFSEGNLTPALQRHLVDNFPKATVQATKDGVDRIAVVGPMTGPTGKVANVKTVWELFPNGSASFITAEPAPRLLK